MPCAEITNAINWYKKSTKEETFPVTAYFTKHYGGGAIGNPAIKDAVHYASGDVEVVDLPTPHLKGILTVSRNTNEKGQMVLAPSLTYEIEIFPDGTLSYLMKLKGKPVGGMPATKVQADCVNGVLLTATKSSEVVTVGVARQPPIINPPK